jgi:hypothetical protein
MATTYLREYADIAVTSSKYAQAGAEPAIEDQTVTTSGASTQSAAFNADTRLIAVAAPATQAVCCLFGANPTATTSNFRLAAGSLTFFGVKPGHKVAFIDVA